MTTAIVVVALVAGLACPLHMLWQRRRGRAASCMGAGDEAEGVQARQRRLAARVDAMSRSSGGRA